MELHRADNVRLMRESVVLTGEINQLRRELRIAKDMRSKSNPTAPQTDNMQPSPPPGGANQQGGRGGMIKSKMQIEKLICKLNKLNVYELIFQDWKKILVDHYKMLHDLIEILIVKI